MREEGTVRQEYGSLQYLSHVVQLPSPIPYAGWEGATRERVGVL